MTSNELRSLRDTIHSVYANLRDANFGPNQCLSHEVDLTRSSLIAAMAHLDSVILERKHFHD